jgi:hypothetical protein
MLESNHIIIKNRLAFKLVKVLLILDVLKNDQLVGVFLYL